MTICKFCEMVIDENDCYVEDQTFDEFCDEECYTNYCESKYYDNE